MIWAPVAMSLALHIGCGGGESNTTPAPAPTTTPAASEAPAASSESTSQLPAQGLQSATNAIATGGNVQIPEDPKEIIRVFMDAMRAGNAEQLDVLFSSTAKQEFDKHGILISPPGTSEAVFEVIEATQQDDAMIVSSKWIEPGETPEEGATEIEILWELRKEINGWRVCAMAADPGDGSELQVVNFENMDAPGTWENEKPANQVAATGEQGAQAPATVPAMENGHPGLPPPQSANTANAAAPGSIPALPPANQLR